MNSITSIRLRTWAAAIVLGTLGCSFATVSSAMGGEAPQVVVKFADLNVSTAQGAATLYRRIHRAAEDVCARMYPSEDAYRHFAPACLQKVISDSVVKVNEPALSAVFASKYGVASPATVAAAGNR